MSVLNFTDALNRIAPRNEPFRLAAGTYVAGTTGGHELVNGYFAVKAINANATFGAACVKAADTLGTIPSEDDQITQDDTWIVKLTTLVVKTGVVLAYYY